MAPAGGSVFWTIDRSNRLFTVRIEGDVSGAIFVDRIRALFQEIGDWQDFSYIYDSLRYHGSINNDHIRILSRGCSEYIYNNCLHVVVNRDPGFPFWLSALRLQYPDWKIYLTESVDSARRLVALVRAGGSPGGFG